MENIQKTRENVISFYCFNLFLYLLVGSNIAYLFGQQSIGLLVSSVFFFTLGFLSTESEKLETKLSQSFFQCVLLLMGQLIVFFFTNSVVLLTLGYVISFSAICLLLAQPLCSMNRQIGPLGSFFNASMPFLGLIASIFVFKYYPIVHSILLFAIPVLLFLCIYSQDLPKMSLQKTKFLQMKTQKKSQQLHWQHPDLNPHLK